MRNLILVVFVTTIGYSSKRSCGLQRGLPVSAARRVWQLELGLSALQQMVPDRVWENLFKVLADDPNFQYILVDFTIVRPRQNSTGAQKEDLMLRH